MEARHVIWHPLVRYIVYVHYIEMNGGPAMLECEGPSCWPHLLARQDVVLEVLHQLGELVLVQQEVPLLFWQRRHGAICGQEEGHRRVGVPVQQLGHSGALQERTQAVSRAAF